MRFLSPLLVSGLLFGSLVSASAQDEDPLSKLPPPDSIKLSTVIEQVEGRPGFYGIGSAHQLRCEDRRQPAAEARPVWQLKNAHLSFSADPRLSSLQIRFANCEIWHKPIRQEDEALSTLQIAMTVRL
jgi:hypothetical protein